MIFILYIIYTYYFVRLPQHILLGKIISIKMHVGDRYDLISWF